MITANRQNAIRRHLWGSEVSLGINLWEALKEVHGILECTNVFGRPLSRTLEAKT